MSTGGIRLESVHAGYGRTTVLRDVTLEVTPGSVVALLGSNGAGKTTLLRVASGLIRPTAGRVFISNDDLTRSAPNERLRSGACLIPEGRGVFRSLTVGENLTLQIPPWCKDPSVEVALEAFPVLRDRLRAQVGQLSGGQQQMVALCRAFLARPAVVMLDEVSMGLAPVVVDDIFQALRSLAARGVALLIVEQYIERALELADRVYLLDRGQIAFSGAAADLDSEAVMRNYLGHGAAL